MPEVLQHALARGWGRGDTAASLLAIFYQAIQMTHTSWAEQAIEVFAICLELLLIRQAFQLRRYIGRAAGSASQQRRRLLSRTALAALARVSALIVVPATVDLVHAIAPGLSPSTSGSDASLLGSCTRAAGAWACASSLAAHLRGLVMLLLPVAWCHALLGAAIGWQLPPVAHALLQATSVGLLLRRAPKVCRQFVDLHPANGRVASAVYFVIQQAASLLCLGSRVPLAAVASDSCPCAKCIAVVWALEVSLGLVWPTLMVWQSQVGAAREWAMAAAADEEEAAQQGQQQLRRQLGQQQQGQQQQEQQQQQQQGDGPPPPHPSAVVQYERSAYARLCTPVLKVADACPGGWAVVVCLAALYPYLAAVLTEPQCPK